MSQRPFRGKGSLSLIFIGLVLACVSPQPLRAQSASSSVEGAKLTYKELSTPESSWGEEAEQKWMATFEGELVTEYEISYRGVVLPAGRHAVWSEKGKDGWYFLNVGTRAKGEAEKPPARLRARFKLHPQKEGSATRQMSLKLTHKATKLKFSLRAGASEGHGNFRILRPEPPESPEEPQLKD